MPCEMALDGYGDEHGQMSTDTCTSRCIGLAGQLCGRGRHLGGQAASGQDGGLMNTPETVPVHLESPRRCPTQ